MRALLVLMLVLALGATGCAKKNAKTSQPSQAPRAGKSTPAPATRLEGMVSRVEPVGRFVVLTFPLSQMPAVDQRLTLYRHGAKVGEVKVSGPQRDNNIVADIVTGEPQVGDEARLD